VNGDATVIDRQAILQRLERWLDDVLSAEDPPGGVDAELLAALTVPSGDSLERPASDGGAGDADAGREIDAYGLWAAMTTLAHEVKLQGRAFKELDSTLGRQAAATADEIRRAYRERERDAQREAERRCRREILGAVIDMRDRLERGLDTAHAAHAALARRRGLLACLLGRFVPDGTEALAAVVTGYELGLERLDQLLEDLGARRIRCEGEVFDPRRMNAIDRQHTTAVPPGTVVEVHRSGYEWHGEVFRTAQVTVACPPVDGMSDD
jgi:molecular chaperone GrpE